MSKRAIDFTIMVTVLVAALVVMNMCIENTGEVMLYWSLLFVLGIVYAGIGET